MTKMMKSYLIKLAFRITVFLTIFILYIIDKNMMWQYLTRPVIFWVSPIHLLWTCFMIIMLTHLFPDQHRTMALLKRNEEKYQEVGGFHRLELLEVVQDWNVIAWPGRLVWLIFNGMIGLLFLLHILDHVDLFMCSVCFFLCDYICILFFCPFQKQIMRNKCCVNCRIYDWGHFMMFTPMLFIQNFFSWSLFFTSIVVLIHWEVVYAKHPERFWSGSNKRLQCANCKDKTCQLKPRIKNPVQK